MLSDDQMQDVKQAVGLLGKQGAAVIGMWALETLSKLEGNPKAGLFVTLAVAEACVRGIDAGYKGVQSQESPEDAANFAEGVMVGLAEIFKDSLNVSIVKREA